MAGVRLPEQNQVLLTGRLTRDPEVSFTPQGTAKCWFSVAVNQNYKDKTTGDWKEVVSYVPVVVWRQAAERCKDILHKGSPVHIEGRLRSREYEDKKSGQKRTLLEVEARRVQFLAPSEGFSGRPEGGDTTSVVSPMTPAKAVSPAALAAPAALPSAADAETDLEEVPF